MMRKLPRMRVRMERMRGSGEAKSRVESNEARELGRQYACMIADLDAMGRELEPLIDRLQDTDEWAAMRLRYVERYKVDDVAYALAYCERHTLRILERAEKKIEAMAKE